MLISFLFREEAISKLRTNIRMHLRRFLGLRIVCLALEIIVSGKISLYEFKLIQLQGCQSAQTNLANTQNQATLLICPEFRCLLLNQSLILPLTEAYIVKASEKAKALCKQTAGKFCTVSTVLLSLVQTGPSKVHGCNV